MIPEPMTAMRCCYFMHQHGFTPKTLLNIGVGRCPELGVWKWLLPDTELVGVDSRARSSAWDRKYFHFAVNDGKRERVAICRVCRHGFCQDPAHERNVELVQATTIDRVASESEGPFFLWMDIDGGEMDALRGAEATLKYTPWMNVEVRDFPWDTGHKNRLHNFITDLGYRLMCEHANCEDRLYASPQAIK